jgi:hypothetical protein
MNQIDPGAVARLVGELHGYELGDAGARRCAEMAASVAAAVAALAAGPQFHEEPATFAATLAALAPEDA